MSKPLTPYDRWLSGTNQNSIPANDNSLRDEIFNTDGIADDVTAQPGSPADGDWYIVPLGATGAQWGTFAEDSIAIFYGGTWYEFVPAEGNIVTVDGDFYIYGGSAGWEEVTIPTSSPADAVSYDNVVSGLTATNVQDAIDELAGGGGGGGMANPMTTGGDVIIGGVSGAPARLAVGTNGQVMTVVSGAPAWAAPGAGSGDVSGPAFATADRIAVFDGTTGKLLKDGGQSIFDVKLIEQNSQSGAYTLVFSDANKHILHPSADTTARTFTIPSNSSVAFPVGTAITFVNQNAAGVLTIAITSDTMRLAAAGTTGSRTLAANGMATALKITSTEWIINGTGLT